MIVITIRKLYIAFINKQIEDAANNMTHDVASSNVVCYIITVLLNDINNLVAVPLPLKHFLSAEISQCSKNILLTYCCILLHMSVYMCVCVCVCMTA